MRHLFNVQLAFLSILVIFSGFAFSQVPQLINYQGVLIDPSTDQPIPDDTYSITFSIYNVPSGSSDIWHEIHSVETKNGLYSVILGSITDLTSGILSGSEKYLGIKVGNDPEMIPRRRIVSVAYAIVSATADSLGDKAAAEYATKIELSTSDGDPPNQGSNQVSWDNLMDVPDGFADGIDNTGGSDGNTLDQAYDQGGPGAGRTIIADAGPVNIEGSGGLSVNGWVGIGITTPEHPLHVKGFFKLEGADFRMAEPSAGDGGRVLVHWGDGSGTNDQMILNFAGDFEEGVKIEGSKLVVNGKVGIGIIAPEHPLHVKGFFKLEGTDFLMADPSRGDGGRALVHWGDGSGTDDQLILNFAGDFEEGVNVQGSKLIIDGQVGIGIADPGNRKLNVVGGSNTAIEASSTGGNAIYATSSAYSAIHAHANCGGGDAAGYFTASEYGTYGVYAKSEDYDALYASSNTAIGFYAGNTSANLHNATAVGAYANVNASNKVVIGNTDVTIISGYANWSTFSDGRFKHAVQENIKGLDFITRLRPVSYKMDVAALNAHLGVKNEAESEYVSNSNKGDIVYSGFIGQELEAAAQEVSYDFSGVVPPQNEKDHYSLRYAEFVVPLVKAVQEQQKMIEQLQNEVAALKKRLVE